MESNKALLPKEVAEAIEACKIPQNPTLYSQLNEYSMSWASDFPGMHMDTIMQALVNGYEVEQTPQDNVRDLFEYFNQPEVGFAGVDVQNKICIMLDHLKIKIDGVNA